MKPILSILLIVLFSVFISCEKETIDKPSNQGLLKRKLEYRSIQDTIPRSISDYEYDWKRRLVKIQDLHSSQLFEYNQKDQLIRKFSYVIDESGSSLRDTTWYKYQNGKLVYEESIPLPPSDFTYTYQIKYEYENSKLVKKKEYQDHQFRGMIVYEYKNDLLITEINYIDSLRTDYYTRKDYAYDENNQLGVSTLRNVAGWILQAGYYFYDDHGNLVFEYGDQLAEVAGVFIFCNRYEYY